MSWLVVAADTLGGNEMVREALDAFPDSFWGLGSFDPSHYSEAELRRLIPELYSDSRFIGMKPYTRFGIRYDSPKYDVFWEYGNERGFYALLHRIAPDFSEIHNLAPKYPNIIWVPVHCGGSYPVADMAIECIKRYPNVYAEITLTPVPFGMIDYLAEHAGADRILYGSDLPMRDPRQQLGWVLYSRLSVEDKKKILGGNAVKVLQHCGWRGVAG
jgi:predicted TIM-barrel fold metal-dependent hydrolase